MNERGFEAPFGDPRRFAEYDPALNAPQVEPGCDDRVDSGRVDPEHLQTFGPQNIIPVKEAEIPAELPVTQPRSIVLRTPSAEAREFFRAQRNTHRERHGNAARARISSSDIASSQRTTAAPMNARHRQNRRQADGSATNKDQQ